MVKTLSSLPCVFLILWLGYREGLISGLYIMSTGLITGKGSQDLI